MDETQTDELDALTALMDSDGWRRFLAHVEAEWGPVAYAAKIDRTIASCRSNHDDVEGPVCELGAAMRAAQLAAQWPARRVKELRASAATSNPAKRLFQRRAH